MINPSSVLSFFVPKIALYMCTYKVLKILQKNMIKIVKKDKKYLTKLTGGGYNNIENLQLIGKLTKKFFPIMEDIYYER